MATRIYLDADGVLAGQVPASLERLKYLLPEDFVWPNGVWDYTEATGLSAQQIWSQLSDHDYWANLPLLPHAEELVRTAAELVGIENVRIATKPILSPWSASGKMAWIQKHFPQLSRQFSIIIDKSDLAGPDSILVDDSTTNVDAFREAGGRAILWPCLQNHRYAEDPRVGLDELKSLFNPVTPISTFETKPDGSICIWDSFGAEIRMCNGYVSTWSSGGYEPLDGY